MNPFDYSKPVADFWTAQGQAFMTAQQQAGKLARHCAPTVFRRNIEHDEVAIVAGQKKSGRGNGPALADGRDTDVLLVRSESNDIERLRQPQLGLHEDVPHLLEA